MQKEGEIIANILLFMQRIRYNFVIITPGRCGSEHLSETLNYFGDITMDGEIFNRNNYSSDSFNHHLRKDTIRSLIGFFFNREKLSRYWMNIPLHFAIQRFLSNDSFSKSSIVGFKLSLDQLHAYPYILYILSKKKCRIIYLYREDKLSQVLSLIKARNTGEYHYREERNARKTYNFNVKQVGKQYQQLIQWESSLMHQLANEDSYTLSYESLFSAYPTHINAIRSFLNLSESESFQYSSLIKGNSARLEEWVSNIEEIKKELASTYGIQN